LCAASLFRRSCSISGAGPQEAAKDDEKIWVEAAFQLSRIDGHPQDRGYLVANTMVVDHDSPRGLAGPASANQHRQRDGVHHDPMWHQHQPPPRRLGNIGEPVRIVTTHSTSSSGSSLAVSFDHR